MQNTSKIIYLLGASGSGKDTILSTLRKQFDNTTTQQNVMVAHRYICRDWQSGSENHIQLSEKEFNRRQQLGLFALDWQANGLHYGIGREIDLWLAQGQTVIVNGSRGYLPTAIERYGEQLAPVLITVDETILRQRLINRGRESHEMIEARLKRNQQLMCDPALLLYCYCIDNSAQIDKAVTLLMTYINRLADDPVKE